jgi:hypothetical protein
MPARLPSHNRFTTATNAGRGRASPVVLYRVSAPEKLALITIARRYGVTLSEWARYRALSEGAASKTEIARLREAHQL